MESTMVEKINALPQYRRLVRERSRLAWLLSAVMLVAYFGFILLIAFNPDFFKIVVLGEYMTIGFPLGVGIILLAFVLTGIYVRKANSDFDELTQQIRDEVQQ
ncbi:DUF485 domain-containing protein [Thiomicrorhabdus aquaedulcis]|uniref:DUF485 domain-containing protein n=1 Tax=Thiomicrorhabdus aquaedulcis TaxID=2211106 RepID=UPI000FD92BC0|nr:DUF485 domain-containing protein [Thiomicrorhabdus aquaedulcis]